MTAIIYAGLKFDTIFTSNKAAPSYLPLGQTVLKKSCSCEQVKKIQIKVHRTYQLFEKQKGLGKLHSKQIFEDHPILKSKKARQANIKFKNT